jgi:tRNA A-37 threonylcarbamoyl transferase component Bud32
MDKSLQRQILEHCRHIAGAYQIAAICQSSDYEIQQPSARSTIEVLLVLKSFPAKLISNVRLVEGRNVVFFVVDKWIFERDVDRGFLGEALASLLIFPCTMLFGTEFLRNQEIALKRRLILELLENLVLTYPELSYTLQIKPEYFMFEVMLNRVRVFPPMAYGASQFLCKDARKDQIELVLSGYTEALRQLKLAGVIDSSNGYVIISAKFIEESSNPKVRFSNILKKAPRTLFTSLFGVFPQLLNFLAQNAEALFQFQTPPWKKEFYFSKNFEDPQKYIYVPTTQGLVSLSDKADIKEFARRILKTGEYDKIGVKRFGGVLNDVFLIEARVGKTERKVLAKRFRDLHGMKWFPLSMWSIGARSFALLGRSRLERETAINGALSKAGFHVPKILHVSANERLVFMDFIDGENASKAIKRIAAASTSNQIDKELTLITQIGETYAKVHAINIVLGDTKPENSMIDSDGNLFLLDFEQSSRNGDCSWDVACFLYYCGHYLPLNGDQKAELIAKAFIKGYLSAGGDPEVIKCAGIARFTRVFSIFTLPSILRVMSNACKNIEGKRCKRW